MDRIATRKSAEIAATWLREERARVGISIAELWTWMQDLADDLARGAPVPSIGEIEAFESEERLAAPRWIKLARYALDRAELERKTAGSDEPESRISWLHERNFHDNGDLLGMARPYVWRDEYRLLNLLNTLDEKQRSALRGFLREWRDHHSSTTREDVARRLLKAFEIEAPVIDAEEAELLDRFRRGSPAHQVGMLQAIEHW